MTAWDNIVLQRFFSVIHLKTFSFINKTTIKYKISLINFTEMIKILYSQLSYF